MAKMQTFLVGLGLSKPHCVGTETILKPSQNYRMKNRLNN